MSPLDRSIIRALRPAASGGDLAGALAALPDPERLARRADEAGVGPTAAWALRGAALPPAASRSLEEIRLRAAASSMRLACETRECLALLRAAGIPALVIKGVALAAQAYSDPSERDALDLDLLVPRRDAARAVDVLRARGLVPPHPVTADLLDAHHSIDLIPAAPRPPVDVHWRIPARPLPEIPEELTFRRAVQVRIDGGLVPTLDPEVAALEASLRLISDGVAPKALVDLSRLALAHLDWRRVREMARRMGALGAVAAASQLSRTLLGAPTPPASFFGSTGRSRARLVSRSTSPRSFLDPDALRYFPGIREVLVGVAGDDAASLPRAVLRLLWPPPWEARRSQGGGGSTALAYVRRPFHLLRRGAFWLAAAIRSRRLARDGAREYSLPPGEGGGGSGSGYPLPPGEGGGE